MPFTQRALDDKPVLISTFSGDISAETFFEWNTATIHWLAAQTAHYPFLILDLREAETSFDVIVKQMNAVRTLEFRNANGIEEGEIVFVGTGAMIKLTLSIFNTPQLGNQQVPVFHTLEDAIEYVERKLG